MIYSSFDQGIGTRAESQCTRAFYRIVNGLVTNRIQAVRPLNMWLRVMLLPSGRNGTPRSGRGPFLR